MMKDFNVRAESAARVSVPLGGPIYIPNLIGPLTCIPEFEASASRLLHELKVELDLGMDSSSSMCEVYLSVDELKIFSEEELLDKTLKESFKEKEVIESSSQREERNFDEENVSIENAISTFTSEQWLNFTQETARSSGKKRKVDNPFSERNRCSAMKDDSLVDSMKARSSVKPVETNLHNRESSNRTASGCKGKGHRKIVRKNDEGYIERIEETVKLKHKQEEDKAAARLHSFNGSRSNQCNQRYDLLHFSIDGDSLYDGFKNYDYIHE